MPSRVGGVVPDSYGLSHSVYVPTATETNPVEAGDTLVFDTTGPYHARKTAAGETVQLVAKHRVTDGLTPLGVYIYGFTRVDRFTYSGTAPAIGDAIASAGDDTVTTAAEGTGSGFVLYVDETRNYIEVAM